MVSGILVLLTNAPGDVDRDIMAMRLVSLLYDPNYWAINLNEIMKSMSMYLIIKWDACGKSPTILLNDRYGSPHMLIS